MKQIKLDDFDGVVRTTRPRDRRVFKFPDDPHPSGCALVTLADSHRRGHPSATCAAAIERYDVCMTKDERRGHFQTRSVHPSASAPNTGGFRCLAIGLTGQRGGSPVCFSLEKHVNPPTLFE